MLPFAVVRRVSVALLLASCVAAGGVTIGADKAATFQAEYVVEVRDPATRMFHVTATFTHVHERRLELSLPIWTPGWYTLEYYAKNVSQLKVTDGRGRRLVAPLIRAQTWSIETQGAETVVVDFDYKADVLALNQAKITETFAFFTGTQLFLEPVGHRNVGATVRFVVPKSWGIATALRDTADASVFHAADYDELVDAPTWLGAFVQHRFDIDGKPHIVVLDPTRTFADEDVAAYLKSLGTMVGAAKRVFGELPYDKYMFFWLPGKPESNASGGLEHGNSFVICCGGPTRLGVGQGAAHEFFHLWNVKRIRPAELWPYDYSRPVDTPSLWMSEGVTDYYAPLILYRAGLQSEQDLIKALQGTIDGLESNPERRLVSPSDASMATFRQYGGEPISYYAAGRVLGALLDLSILHDTGGRHGLDDVMRALYAQFYKKGKGFTAADMERTVSAVAGRDYREFFRRYVTGMETPPYATILGYAGVHALPERVYGVLGILSSPSPGGRLVTKVGPTLPAGKAGLAEGDVIVNVDGAPVAQSIFYPNGCCMLDKYGKTVSLKVQRGSTQLQLSVPLDMAYRERDVEFAANLTADQVTVRHAWLAKR